jgi:hypothetical protein
MNEKYVLDWLWSNWPMLTAALAMASVYVRVGRFAARHEQTSNRVLKLMRIHAKRHPEDGADLFDDGDA